MKEQESIETVESSGCNEAVISSSSISSSSTVEIGGNVMMSSSETAALMMPPPQHMIYHVQPNYWTMPQPLPPQQQQPTLSQPIMIPTVLAHPNNQSTQLILTSHPHSHPHHHQAHQAQQQQQIAAYHHHPDMAVHYLAHSPFHRGFLLCLCYLYHDNIVRRVF